MKTLIPLLCIFFSTLLNAQTIPNANFESWITDSLGRQDPAGWLCSNLFSGTTSVFQDVDRYGTGLSAKLITVPTSGPLPEGGYLLLHDEVYSGTILPTALKGYFKCNATSGDFFVVNVSFYDSLGIYITGNSITTINNCDPNWTAFSIPLTFNMGVSVYYYWIDIYLNITSGTSGTSIAHIDDLSWDFNTGVEETSDNFSECFISKNGSSFTLNFSNLVASDIRASLFDVTGREVLFLANDKFSPGAHSVSFESGQLAAGIYNCVVTDGREKKVVKVMME